MKKILIDSNLYYKEKEKCNKAIEKVICNSEHSNSVIITNLENIEFDDYDDIEHNFHIIDKKMSLKTFNEFGNESIILLDYSDKSEDEIKTLLGKVRNNILLLNDDIQAIVVICDKLKFPFLIDMIRNIFTIRAIDFSEKEMNMKLKSVNRRAFIVKYSDNGYFIRVLKKTYMKIRNVFNKVVQ